MIDRLRIVECAREYLKTPFHHQARLKGVGIDCVGLIVAVSNELSLGVQDYVEYARQPNPPQLLDHVQRYFDQIETPEPGDMLLFWLSKKDRPQHVGIMSTDDRMIHAYASVGRVVEHHFSLRWKSRVHSAWRFKGN